MDERRIRESPEAEIMTRPGSPEFVRSRGQRVRLSSMRDGSYFVQVYRGSAVLGISFDHFALSLQSNP
jgi:hypothetical protein